MSSFAEDDMVDEHDGPDTYPTFGPGQLKREPQARALVRAADAAQYARPKIPAEQRGQIRVRLLNATPDPLGSIAALCEQYKGNVIRSLSEVTDQQRRQCLDDMESTVLNGPLEAAQFHWQIEGVTRSITHQMVRSRASFFAQESLRFAVPEGNWSEEVPYPPSLANIKDDRNDQARNQWRIAIEVAQHSYQTLIELGMPAEEARGVLPHDMPTRIHWVMDLRTMLTEAGKRTCTQAQFPWRLIFAGMAQELRSYGAKSDVRLRSQGQGMRSLPQDGWQFREIADRLRPVCYQTGQCGFMAKFDRSCSIRSRVDRYAANAVPSKKWGYGAKDVAAGRFEPLNQYADIQPIQDWEWAADPGAARS